MKLIPIVKYQWCEGAQGFPQSTAHFLYIESLLLECGIAPQLSAPHFQ